MNAILNWASKINDLPLISKISPSGMRAHTPQEQQGFANSQALAQRCAEEVASLIQIGWTELQTAQLMETWLRDHGVRTFFHKPFVWWGDRTRFVGVKNYWDYLPGQRVLCEGEVFILDVAPVVDGFISDIGFSGRMGEHPKYDAAIHFLEQLRVEIPALASDQAKAPHLWQQLDETIRGAGYDNIHATYPFGVLGHRLHKTRGRMDASLIHFGWQSYWELLSRGLFGQLLNADFQGSLDGLWAIEPHIGGKDFGVKFEEILVVENGSARWLDHVPHYHTERF